MTNPNIVRARLGETIRVERLGLELCVTLNDDGQPTVFINTEGMWPEYVYDERTGLPGTAEPYTVREDGTSAEVISPTGGVVSRHFPETMGAASHARFAAQRYASVLNEAWSEECGMPDIQVLMGDAALYDSEDHNPDLRERRQGEKTDA